MTDWYYADAANTRHGPITTPALLQLRQQGSIGEQTLLWREGLAGWLPLRDLAHEVAPAPEPVTPDSEAATAAPAVADAWALDPVETPATGAATT